MAADEIANGSEVLAFVTKVLRGELEEARMGERLKAADMLGRRYRLFDDGSGEGPAAVTLIDDVAGATGERPTMEEQAGGSAGNAEAPTDEPSPKEQAGGARADKAPARRRRGASKSAAKQAGDAASEPPPEEQAKGGAGNADASPETQPEAQADGSAGDIPHALPSAQSERVAESTPPPVAPASIPPRATAPKGGGGG